MSGFPVALIKSNTTLKLDNGVRYTLTAPLTLGGSKPLSKFNLTTKDPKGAPAIIEFRPADKVWDAVTLAANTSNCSVNNIVMDTKTSTRGICVKGANHSISRFSTTDRSHCAIFVDGVNGLTISDCTQQLVVPVGFFYARNATNITLTNIETWGDYYENEFRLHGCSNVKFLNIRCYAANPQNDVDFDKNGVNNEGDKDNAFRIHDSANVLLDGCIGTGNFRFGPMGDYNGGLEAYENSINTAKYPKQKDRDAQKAEWQRQMAMRTTGLVVQNSQFYGWIRLEAGLTDAVFHNVQIFAPGASPIVRVDPAYVAGPLTRPAPTASWTNVQAYSLAIPGAEKAALKGPYDIVNLCRKYAQAGKFNKGVGLFSNPAGMKSTAELNVKMK